MEYTYSTKEQDSNALRNLTSCPSRCTHIHTSSVATRVAVSCVPFMRDNIKMVSKEMCFEYLDCIHMIRVGSSEHGNESSGSISALSLLSS